MAYLLSVNDKFLSENGKFKKARAEAVVISVEKLTNFLSNFKFDDQKTTIRVENVEVDNDYSCVLGTPKAGTPSRGIRRILR